MKLTILAVNWWAKDFADLLIKTALAYTTTSDYEILIIDNSGELNFTDYTFQDVPVRILTPGKNFGHGKGLNLGVKQAKGEYILVLDIDSHILMRGWDEKILPYFEQARIRGVELIGGSGGQLKPFRPCVGLFNRKFFKKNQLSFEAREFDGVNFDVGIHMYFKILSLGFKIEYFNQDKTSYQDVLGDEYNFGRDRFVYHNWWGTRWYDSEGTKVHQQIDGITFDDYYKKKNNLFAQI
jgi:GT2 family glycosyltransferase